MKQVSIVPPDPKKHREALFDFYGKVFSDRQLTDLTYYDAVALCRRAYFTNSHYDWQASRIGLVGDTRVSHFGVWGYEMRIGSARVRTGGVGAVATHGEFRGRGLMDRTARASLEAMREHGYDMTVLFGIDDFHDRFGYVRAWSEADLYVDVADRPSEPPELPVRRFIPGRRPDLVSLYNTHHATTTGTAVRPTYLVPVNFHHGLLMGYLWTGAGDEPTGYVVVRRLSGRLICTEYCGQAGQALPVLGMLARRRHCPAVQFQTLPYQSQLCRLVRRGNYGSETDHRRRGGPMVHMFSLRTALSKLTAELSRRLAGSHLKAWQGVLLIADAREQATLRIANRKVSLVPPRATPHAVRGGNEVAQLIIGTDAPAEIVEAGSIKLSGGAAMLLPVLFPAQHPQLSEADRY